MKKILAIAVVLMMLLSIGASAFAIGELTTEQAKQAAASYVGFGADQVSFVKAYRNWDDGRQVYEIEFYANGQKYEMDVDAYTGAISDFSVEYCGGFNQPANNVPAPGCGGNRYGRDWDDWDDPYDDWNDWDDFFDWDD
ncbi:MAG: PepSY domain-containing protein [Oscillospiraceae bacterium]|nr:PepSY domain-containing protein [Oscillospiraceae bacterium]